MFEWLIELLFKYRPIVFEQGEFRFGVSPVAYVAMIAMVAGAASTVVAYRHVRGDSRPRDRLILLALRLAALAIVVFCLFRPVLVVKAAVAQQNFLGILVDDSRSMRISDRNGEARSGLIAQQVGVPESPLLKALSDRFVLRFFRFSKSVERVNSVNDLSFGGTQTRVGPALTRAQQELAGLPLAGLVVMSDGADTTEAALTDSLLALKADQIPVFTVGVGQSTLSRDIQISRVATPRSVLKGSSLVIDVTLTQSGYQGTTVPVNVESDGRILGTEQVTLPADGEPMTARVRFTVADAGPRVFRFRVPTQTDEMVTENNSRDVLINVSDHREKILYFEGEPRFEVKFIRRALADDKNLQVVVLQRTAENKYLRLDVDHPEELVAGFPKTREELFSYRGLILGSIEAGAFTGDQLRMIADFVDKRGGGLLMLGGRRSFTEGGYAGTPVAEVLPVEVEGPAAKESSGFLSRLDIRPTRAGLSHAATQIAPTEAASAAKWKELPQLTSVNQIKALKPGATALLTGGEGTGGQTVLAFQRYGRGRAMALAVQDTWVWQLHSKIPLEDNTHENLWRQLVRWLVDGTPDQVTVVPTPDRVESGEVVTVKADVVDPSFVEVNNAHVVASITGPNGLPAEVPLQWTGSRNGEYAGTFVAGEDGLYDVKVEATRDKTTLGAGVGQVRVAPSDSEYFDAAMREPLLQRIAEETGGRFYTESTLSALPEDLRYTNRGVTSVEERELWDMPALLIALVGLMVGEWTFRRRRGLA